jgi:hypothetical protein
MKFTPKQGLEKVEEQLLIQLAAFALFAGIFRRHLQ